MLAPIPVPTMGVYSVDWNGPLDYWNGLLEHWNGILEWITEMATYLTRCSLGGKAGLGPDSNYSNVLQCTLRSGLLPIL